MAAWNDVCAAIGVPENVLAAVLFVLLSPNYASREQHARRLLTTLATTVPVVCSMTRQSRVSVA
jgi:hypothetical protein